jgi:AcrR family transcriptional regulator
MRAPRLPPQTPSRSQPRTLTGRQSELFDQLEQLFVAEGFAHLPLDDIVSKLHCSKMTLYTLAPSRELLTLGVLRRFFDEANRQIEEKLRSTKEGATQIRQALVTTADVMSPMSPVCFNDVVQFETTRELYETFSQRCNERLISLLSAAVKSDNKSSARIPLVAEIAQLVLEDIYSGELETKIEVSRERALEQLIHIVLSSAGIQPSSQGTRIRRIK